MWKSLCSLFKKDCRMMMSGKFFLVVLGSLVLYTLFINFGYVKLDVYKRQEQEARRPLRSGETLTPEQTAYFNAVLDYVKECRPLLNQGQYHLPEPPQLADFDQSLQDYKKQIEAELEQEAAAAGLTVEEYLSLIHI